ncbi:major facilitator superfamily domain-containing protein [Mycena floridula]|nr:major facilitator superfamily domain-containing protein [Mycena floridula]
MSPSNLPWWRKPSPIWIFVVLPLSTLVLSPTIALKIEIFTQLACLEHMPDIFYSDRAACAQNYVVQAAASKVLATTVTVSGMLSVLTTGWWGSFSDRHGRTLVFGLCLVAQLVVDLNFIIAVEFYDRIPGGYWSLLVCAIVEGLFGGEATSLAAGYGYMSDTTTSETRAKTFSRAAGLYYAGLAAGPALAGLLIRLTSSGALLIFYMAAVAHLALACGLFFFVPESRTLEQRRESALVHRASSGERSGLLKAVFVVLSPLSVFLPKKIDANAGAFRSQNRDWSLMLLALGFGFAISVEGCLWYVMQYSTLVFEWTMENVAFWITELASARAVYLTIIFPPLVSFLKRRIRDSKTTEANESAPLLATLDDEGERAALASQHSSRLDFIVAQVSLLMEIIAFGSMGLVNSGTGFTIFGMLTALGGGFKPAMQALALEIFTVQGGIESGKLFGGMAVIGALSGQVFAPALYGQVHLLNVFRVSLTSARSIYWITVATHPNAIFFALISVMGVAAVLLTMVKIPKRQTLQPATIEDERTALEE